MPACASDNIPNLTESLRSNLSVEQDIDQSVISSAKKALLHQINFKSAVKPHSLQIDSLRTKYIPLNPSKNYGPSSHLESGSKRDISFKGKMNDNNAEKSGEGLPSPRVVLYPADKIALQWKKIHKVGSGLENMGNTCYVNAPLQALFYTPPLVNYCYTQDHFLQCENAGSSCLMCEFIRHAREHFKTNKNYLAPSGIFARVKQKTISTLKLFTNGKQEDAHEFLRYMIDGMQKSCLNGYNKLDRYSKETTVINQIFGGFLRSQVLCTRCKNRSNTYDPFMDLSLDLRNNTSVDKCLDKFFMPEYLEGDNAYMCPVCKQKVRAQKRFSIQKAPNVLTIHLKRFDFDRMCKITRYIDFEKKINIRPYMSFRQGEPVLYDLCSIIVHSGGNMNGGHYYSYNKAPNMVWYKMNDELVQQVSAQKVFHCEAYVLLYCKTELNYQGVQMAKTAYMGPMKPLSMFPNGNNNHKKANGIPTNELGTAIVRKTSTKSLFSPDKPLFTPDKITKSASTSSILPPTHDKVSFGIKPNPHKDPNKPPIIVKIKNGKVYNETEEKKAKLVPYGNDSDSDSSRSSGSRKRKKEKDADGDKESKVASTAINNIIMNGHLDTTTSVPGNNRLLHTITENGLTSPTSKTKELYLKLNKNTKLNGDSSALLSPKVNATNNHWSVQLNDSAPSPCSSSNHSSTNSTSEWHVTGNKDQGKLSDKKQNGWTVTPIGSVTSDCKDIHPTDGLEKNINGVFSESCLLGSKTDSSPLKKSHSETSVPSAKPITELYHFDKTKDITINGITNPAYDKDCESSFKVNSKKEKCDNYKLDDFYYNNRMRVDVSDKQHLLSEPSSPQISHKKHKKSKKAKKEKEGKYEELVNESSSSGDVQHKKLKKKKKKHRKHERDDSDTEQKIKKLKRKSEEVEGDIDSKKSKINGEEEYEWVEKKVESKPIKQDDGLSWDYYINKDKRDEKPVHVSGWDGQKSSNIVKELERNSMHGYGDSVLSWDGNKSKLNEECDKERVRVKRKIDKEDSYDEEYDRGKVKKVKTKQDDDKSFGFNPFQKFQDYRNKKSNGSSSSHSSPSSNKRWKSSYSFHGKHSYSRNPHNGNHHSSNHHHYNHHHNHHRSDNNYRHDNRHYSKH